MKKIYKVISLIISAVLVLLAFAGCGAQKKTVNGIELMNGNSEAISLFNNVAASMPLLSSASFEIPAVTPEEATVITDKSLYLAGNGITDDSALLREGINLAATYSTGVFVISSEVKIEESIVVPANVSLEFRGKGKIILGDSAYLYFENGAKIIAGMNRIFAGAVNNIAVVENSKNPSAELVFAVRAEWFGAAANDNACDAAGVQVAVNVATKVYFGVGRYDFASAVTLPANGKVDLIGSGKTRTELITGQSGASYFTANGTEVGFYDMKIAEIGHPMYSTFISLDGGSLKISSVLLYGFKKAVVVNNSNSIDVEFFYATANLEVFTFTNCSNINFSASLSTTNKSFLICENCSDINLINSSSVWGFGTDMTLNGCTNIRLNALGFDLGYNNKSGSSFPYGENLYAIYMNNCSDFSIKNLWCASNAGLSYTNSGNVGKVENRTGMYITNSYKGSIEFCTITNHPYGIQILNSPAASETAGNGILIHGNQFVGNEKYEAYLTNAKNVTFEFNSHKQYHSGEKAACVEAAGTGCSNIVFRGDTFYTYQSTTEILNAFPNSTVYFDSIINATTGNPILS